MRVSLHLATAALLVSLAPASAAAQGNPADADTREVLAYRLTMPKLLQLNALHADLQRQEQADPEYQRLLKLKRELALLEQKEELTAADEARMAELDAAIAELEAAEDEDDDLDLSLSGLVARMEADPRIAGALKRANLGAREATVMQLAFFQAALAAHLLEEGSVTTVPPGVNAENVKFYQTHKAEIGLLTALAEQERQ
ncbi:MAG: hypothetical protein OER21_08745 [Gemmatimonadota bacterium]|nr:hypothetical protein [Gemmatimonadota bacterium]